jgi:hypothetical protein
MWWLLAGPCAAAGWGLGGGGTGGRGARRECARGERHAEGGGGAGGGGVEGGQEEGQLWQVRRRAQGLQGALVGAQQQVDECGVRRGRWQRCILHAEHRQWQERDGREAGRRELKPARTTVQQQPPCGASGSCPSTVPGRPAPTASAQRQHSAAPGSPPASGSSSRAGDGPAAAGPAATRTPRTGTRWRGT